MSRQRTDASLSRREALKLAAGAVLASRFGHPLGAFAQTLAASPRFFTEREFQIVEVLTELVIPADEHSPGAREAKVAPFIDAMLAEANPEYPEDAKLRQQWKTGLETARSVSRELFAAEILDGTSEQQTRLLERLSSAEQADTPEGNFFALLKEWTVDVYYTSEIGIHQELGYKGNTVLDEFVGELPKGPARSEPTGG